MLLALSGGQKLGLLLVAGIFICFALASSFLFPRSNPDWPGLQRVRLFVAVSAALVVAMMSAMFLLAREDEAEAGGAEPARTEGAATDGEPTESAPAETQPAAEQGDPAAGKQVFESAGCGACHTLADAGTNGQVGPNLDQAKPDRDLVVERVTNGAGAMPSFKGQLSDEQIQDVAAYVSQAAGASG